MGESERPYLLTSVSLDKLNFSNHEFNPRKPSTARIGEIMASIGQLTMISPLTCAYVSPEDRIGLENGTAEPVVLIDGRHRFSALQEMAIASPDWASKARVDLKIYYGLQRSDLFQLATYLNRTRRNLRKGEYYQVIVKIFEERKAEIEAKTRKIATEKDIFDEISERAVPNKTFDLSIGRIVGLTAFDEEEAGAWYPMVGLNQRQRYQGPEGKGYCPLTAGNLAELLGKLCNPGPYKDSGKRRDTEIGNVLHLGRIFRAHIIDRVVEGYETATGETVACKFWCLSAFGSILQESRLAQNLPSECEWLLADPKPNWPVIESAVKSYRELMDEQAAIVNEYKASKQSDPNFLVRAWSYQTQREQVKIPLREKLYSVVPGLAPQ